MPPNQPAGRYEADTNILHLWFPHRLELNDEPTIRAFFEMVRSEWVDRCPQKPYLLVNYANVHLAPAMAEVYANNIAQFLTTTLGTFRYGLAANFSGVTVALGNMRIAAPPNIFPDEATARAAIAKAKEGTNHR